MRAARAVVQKVVPEELLCSFMGVLGETTADSWNCNNMPKRYSALKQARTKVIK